jgi:hypothetical protein
MPGWLFTTDQAAASLFFKTAHTPLGANRGMTELYPMMTSMAREFKQLVQSVGHDQLAARTPCTKYDVRALVNHLLYWGPWLEAAARKEPPPTETRGETEVDLTNGEWAAALEKRGMASSTPSACPAPGKAPRQWAVANCPRRRSARWCSENSSCMPGIWRSQPGGMVM